jgi:hypothetical protein
MRAITKAKWQLAWELPVLVLLTPALVLWHGGGMLIEFFMDHIQDRLRWGRYCDDYADGKIMPRQEAGDPNCVTDQPNRI